VLLSGKSFLIAAGPPFGSPHAHGPSPLHNTLVARAQLFSGHGNQPSSSPTCSASVTSAEAVTSQVQRLATWSLTSRQFSQVVDIGRQSAEAHI